MATSDTIQLPPSPTPGVPPPEQGPAVPPALPRARWFEAALIVLVAALAFLLGSFPARNSDLWAALAAGRDLVGGTYSPGADPRLPAGAAANPSWLYDVAVYGIYSLAGGPGLLLCKALLVVGLALVLLRLARTGEARTGARGGTVPPRTMTAVPAVCTALALVAMGTRLLLQPATVSYLFLALTLWSLRRDREQARQHLLPPWPLLLLFVVWANVDDWFVLGLSVVALATTGRALDEKREGAGPSRPALRPLCWTLALAAACLVNPAHVRVFRVPAELGWSATGRVLSPFEPAYFATLGPTPAVLAYYPLLVLGLVSFVLNRGRWSWERFLPWLALAALSAAVARTAPFFAVVGGAVLAWNLQDSLAARPVRRRARPGDVLAGRLLVVVLGVLLVACAWPGWLQAPPFEPRRWAVETAPVLERAAARARRWHEEGRLGAAPRGLHLSPESAHAFAWFCPEDRGILDDTLTALVLGEREDPDRAGRLREAGITHVIVHDATRDRLLGSLERLLTDPEQWPLLSVEGNLAVFGWRDPAARGSDPYAGWTLDLDRLAFHPGDDKKAPPEPSDRAPEVRHWWEAFWKPAPPRVIDGDEARLHLSHAEALRRRAHPRHQVSWAAGRLTGLVGAAGSGAGGPVRLVDVSLRLTFVQPQVPAQGSRFDSLPALDQRAHTVWNQFRFQQDDTPPALLYLAIRAARRALALNPQSAQTHLVLGESYLQLLHGTRERAWTARLGQLERLRRVQASTALNRAIALKPDLAHAHYRLAGLYRQMGYRDLALKHQQACLSLAEKGDYPLEVPLEDFKADLARLARDVEDQLARYAEEARGTAVLRRASLAMEKGLAGKALEVLLASDVSAFGREGMELELELLLKTGRAGDVAQWTTPDQKDQLGGPAYHWRRAQAMAATGHYALAQEEMTGLAEELAREAGAPNNLPLQEAMAVTVSKVVLDEQAAGESVAHRAVCAITRSILQGRVQTFENSLRQIAETRTVRGLLALEAGEVAVAKAAFLEALTIWKDESAAGRIDFNARVIAQDGLRWLR